MEMGQTIGDERIDGVGSNHPESGRVEMIEVCPHLPPRSTSVIVSITGLHFLFSVLCYIAMINY